MLRAVVDIDNKSKKLRPDSVSRASSMFAKVDSTASTPCTCVLVARSENLSKLFSFQTPSDYCCITGSGMWRWVALLCILAAFVSGFEQFYSHRFLYPGQPGSSSWNPVCVSGSVVSLITLSNPGPFDDVIVLTSSSIFAVGDQVAFLNGDFVDDFQGGSPRCADITSKLGVRMDSTSSLAANANGDGFIVATYMSHKHLR